MQINPERTVAIREFPAPKSVKGIARFIGMVNFFSKFVHEIAGIAEPLNRLRRKGVRFQWGEEQEKAFGRLKEAIASPKILAMADFSREFILQTDACGKAVAAVLLQEFTEGKRAVVYASRTLTAQEMKYYIYELEALVVLYGMEKFRMYLEHAEFLLQTDNRPLVGCWRSPVSQEGWRGGPFASRLLSSGWSIFVVLRTSLLTLFLGCSRVMIR